MTRARRAVALLGLAALLGGLAASDVARRESAVAARLGPLEPAVLAVRDLPAGRPLRAGDLAVREVPRRYAPAGAIGDARALLGRRPSAPVGAGDYVTAVALSDTRAAAPVLARGERAADVVALAPAGTIAPGSRVDVLVTRERPGGGGDTRLALQDVEVISARPVAGDPGVSRVAATLRVSVAQAVYLAAAQAFARELRLLPRAPGDAATTSGMSVGEALR